TLYIAIDKKQKNQTLTLNLVRENYELDKFTIHAGVNPALNILRKIIENKIKNNPEKIASYSERVYNKLELDLTQLDQEKINHSKLLKPFAFILQNLDSTAAGKVFLPVFLTETISDFYYQKKPKKQKEIIRASHRSGVKN